jgi:hypothetical protein
MSQNDEQVLLEAERLLKGGVKEAPKKAPLSPRKTVEGADGEEVASVISKGGEPGSAVSLAETISQMDPKNALTPEAKEEGNGAMGALICILLFLFADVGKNCGEAMAVNGNNLNTNVMVITYGIVNLMIAPALIFYNEGSKGFAGVWKWSTLKNYMWPAIFFAISMAVNLMVNQFLDAGMKKVFSQFRIPMTALAGRYVLGVSYTNLQWACIASIIISVFAFMKLKDGGGGGGQSENLVLGIIVSVLGNLFAVIASLLSEKYLKEAKKTPFYIQKMQIELWQLPASLVNMFVICPFIIGKLIYVVYDNDSVYTKNAYHLPKALTRVRNTNFPFAEKKIFDEGTQVYEAQVNAWSELMSDMEKQVQDYSDADKQKGMSKKYAKIMKDIRLWEANHVEDELAYPGKEYITTGKKVLNLMDVKLYKNIFGALPSFGEATDLAQWQSIGHPSMTEKVSLRQGVSESRFLVDDWRGGSQVPIGRVRELQKCHCLIGCRTQNSEVLVWQGQGKYREGVSYQGKEGRCNKVYFVFQVSLHRA